MIINESYMHVRRLIYIHAYINGDCMTNIHMVYQLYAYREIKSKRNTEVVA